MSLIRNLRPFLMRVLRLNIGKPLLAIIVVFIAMLSVFIYETTGSRSGVAANATELEEALMRATRIDSLMSTLLAEDALIPTTGELHWQVGYAPHTFTINVYGTADFGIMPHSSPDEVCINHDFWDESCECSGVGSAESLLDIVPGWDGQFTPNPDEEAIWVYQSVSSKSQPHLKGNVSYAICLESGRFFAGCVSYRP